MTIMRPKNPAKPVRRGRNRPTHPRRAEAALFTKQVLHLRLHGSTFAQIAEALGKASSTCQEAYQRALEEVRHEIAQQATQLRAQECSRLDLYLQKLGPQIDKGDPIAIWRALKISERRSKLLGLDVQPDPAVLPLAPQAPGTSVPTQIAVIFVNADNKLMAPPPVLQRQDKPNGHATPGVQFVAAREPEPAG